MQSNHYMSKNDKVQGSYNGTPFNGVIYDRQIIDQNITLYFIELDEPIKTFCGIQTTICFDARTEDELTDHSNTHYINRKV